MNYEDLVQFDTKLTADVCEWQPVLEQQESNSYYNLACATYYLNKETNQRQGCLYLMNYDLSTNKLDQVDSVNFDTSGILDMKWFDESHILTLDSMESLELFKYQDRSLRSMQKLNVNHSEGAIGLAFDYTTTGKTLSKLVSSNSKGELHVIDCDDTGNLQLNTRFQAHDYEIWSVYIDRMNENIVHSGADDCLLKVWDLRDTSRVKQQCSNLFNGGVCQILGPYFPDLSLINNLNEFNLICSSYDEQIYLLDKRNLKNYVKKSKKLDGGVWKMHINRDNQILCACMHTGVHVVDFESLDSKLYYDKHGLNNLAYGCDWLKINQNEYLVSTCSFYNHELRIWKINKN